MEADYLNSYQPQLQPIQDTLYVLCGKWRIQILVSLYRGKKRFLEISRDIPKITDRMLIKELRELELNQLVTRTVIKGTPVIAEYNLTDYAETLDVLIRELHKWGTNHRSRIAGK